MLMREWIDKAQRGWRVAQASGNNRLNGGGRVFYVIEDANWSIRHDGLSITRHLQVPAGLTTTPYGIRDSVVHYGSINTLFHARKGLKWPAAGNRIIATCFHVAPDDPRAALFEPAARQVDVWHTSCRLTEQKLIELGVPAERIVRIPLGVDSQVFQAVSAEQRASQRRALGIPAGHFVIGSFQKDGNGWGEGLEPKWIKGPDLFCDAVGRLAERLPVFVMLTGPARGYVKRRLAEMGVAHAHRYEDDPNRLARYYQALDLYLVASREEGGPKQILEAMASGVPVISSRVGMAPDVIADGENGYLAPIGAAETLARIAERVLSDLPGQTELIERGLHTARAHDWRVIAQRYQQLLYRPLL